MLLHWTMLLNLFQDCGHHSCLLLFEMSAACERLHRHTTARLWKELIQRNLPVTWIGRNVPQKCVTSRNMKHLNTCPKDGRMGYFLSGQCTCTPWKSFLGCSCLQPLWRSFSKPTIFVCVVGHTYLPPVLCWCSTFSLNHIKSLKFTLLNVM